MMALTRHAKVLLLSCGSFNPVTFTHLRLFEVARDILRNEQELNVIKGIISPVHDAYGKKGLVSSKHRVSMVKIATETSEWVKLDDWESNQTGWTRTLAVLNHAKEQLLSGNPPYKLDNSEDQTKVHVMLLCGGDLLESFATPGLWEDKDIASIVGDYGIVVITRPGSDAEKFVESSDLLRKFKNNIKIIRPNPPSEMSATRLREMLGNGESIRYLTFDGVIDYIKEHGLYGSK